jgi:hypothetical protein
MKKLEKSSRRISRRDFARGGAMAAASAAVLPAALLPDASAQTPAQAPAHEPALSTASEEEVDAKVRAVLRQYNQLLSDPEKLEIRRLLTEGQKPLETLRAFALDNADQPGNVLHLYPDAPPPAPPTPKGAKK